MWRCLLWASENATAYDCDNSFQIASNRQHIFTVDFRNVGSFVRAVKEKACKGRKACPRYAARTFDINLTTGFHPVTIKHYMLTLTINTICSKVKVIPQKKKFPINFFETFPECSPPSIVSKKTIKMIGHHSRLRDMMGQSYPIYACPRANHGHYSSVHVKFCGSSKHILLT